MLAAATSILANDLFPGVTTGECLPVTRTSLGMRLFGLPSAPLLLISNWVNYNDITPIEKPVQQDFVSHASSTRELPLNVGFFEESILLTINLGSAFFPKTTPPSDNDIKHLR